MLFSERLDMSRAAWESLMQAVVRCREEQLRDHLLHR